MHLQRKSGGIVISIRLLLISLVILICNVEDSSGLFRFCHRGSWHELRQEECPYGLLFNQVIETPCFYSQGKDNTTPRIWPTVCGSPFVNDKEESPAFVGEDFVLAQKNGQIQLVQYGITEPADNLPIWDDVVDMATCQDQCYLSFDTDNVPLGTSHEEGDSNEASHGLGAQDEIDETQKMSITDQTLRLGDFLFDELNEESPRRSDASGPDLRIVKIFKNVIKILGKTCPDPFIPEDFRNRILSGFLFLVADTGIGEMDDISVDEFEDIMASLKTCEDKYPTFRIEGPICSMKTIANEIVKVLSDGEEISAPYRPADLNKNLTGFPYKRLDPFAEFAWQAVTVTHATCFANFKPNANMHHKFTSAMERLFGPKIRFRWEHPTQLEDSRMWGTWFLADVDSTHLNFGACISGAYEGAPFSMKLDRPIDQTRRSGRRRRDVDKKDMESYWLKYRSSGGVRKKLLTDSQCFQTEERRDLVVEELKAASCSKSSGNLNAGAENKNEDNSTDNAETSMDNQPTDMATPSYISETGTKVFIANYDGTSSNGTQAQEPTEEGKDVPNDVSETGTPSNVDGNGFGEVETPTDEDGMAGTSNETTDDNPSAKTDDNPAETTSGESSTGTISEENVAEGGNEDNPVAGQAGSEENAAESGSENNPSAGQTTSDENAAEGGSDDNPSPAQAASDDNLAETGSDENPADALLE